jgi:hypothetical protein
MWTNHFLCVILYHIVDSDTHCFKCVTNVNDVRGIYVLCREDDMLHKDIFLCQERMSVRTTNVISVYRPEFNAIAYVVVICMLYCSDCSTNVFICSNCSTNVLYCSDCSTNVFFCLVCFTMW